MFGQVKLHRYRIVADLPGESGGDTIFECKGDGPLEEYITFNIDALLESGARVEEEVGRPGSEEWRQSGYVIGLPQAAGFGHANMFQNLSGETLKEELRRWAAEKGRDIPGVGPPQAPEKGGRRRKKRSKSQTMREWQELQRQKGEIVRSREGAEFLVVRGGRKPRATEE